MSTKECNGSEHLTDANQTPQKAYPTTSKPQTTTITRCKDSKPSQTHTNNRKRKPYHDTPSSHAEAAATLSQQSRAAAKTNFGTNERTNFGTNERTNELWNELWNERTLERTNERTFWNERTNELWNERTNFGTNERSFQQQTTQPTHSETY